MMKFYFTIKVKIWICGKKNLLLVWLIATFCVKVGQFVQNLEVTWLTHFLKHPTPIPLAKIVAQPIQFLVYDTFPSSLIDSNVSLRCRQWKNEELGMLPSS
jgi:hypothetical protein